MLYGYARISTNKQSIERQIRNIKATYPDILDSCIYSESYTGTKIERPVFMKLLKQVRSDVVHGKDVTVVFDSVSRMSRSADEGVKLYLELYELGVDLVFLKEPYISTQTYRKALDTGVPMTGTSVDLILSGVNQYLIKLAQDQIRIAFAQAQKEVDDLHKRTQEGIETARRAGKQIGQKQGAKLTTKKSIAAKKAIRKYSKDFDGSLCDGDCMRLVGIARNTFYKYKKEMFEESEV